MADPTTGIDSLRFYMSGAASDGGVQNVASLSLGGYRSAFEIESFEAKLDTPIPGVRIKHVSGSNGTGRGSLVATGSDALAWTPPGGSPGSSVTIVNGEEKVLLDSTGTKYIRVMRVSSNPLGGATSVNLVPLFNNVIGSSNMTSADEKYRAIFLKNVSAGAIDNVKVRIGVLQATGVTTSAAQLPGSGAGTVEGAASALADWLTDGYAAIITSANALREAVYSLSRDDDALTVNASGRGLLGSSAAAGASDDVAYHIPNLAIATETPVSDQIQTIADEDTAPTGLSWQVNPIAAMDINVGTLAAGEIAGLWLRSAIPSGLAEYIGSGARQIVIAFTFDDVGATTHNGQLHGWYRVSNSSHVQYEVYRGTGGSQPDFNATPFDTFTSAPHSPSGTFPDGDNYVVLRKRNAYNVVSENILSTLIPVSGGSQLPSPPAGPVSYTVAQAVGDVIRMQAVYNPAEDPLGDAADYWAVWWKTDGTNPDPDNDAADYIEEMVDSLDLRFLAYDLPNTFSEGTPFKMIVRTRKGLTGVDSRNTAIEEIEIVTNAPAAPELDLFYGELWGQFEASIPSVPTNNCVIDAINNIRIEPGDRTMALYAGSDLIWKVILDAAGGSNHKLYIPNDIALQNGTVSGTGPATPVDTSDFGSGLIYLNVGTTRIVEIDITNMTFTAAGFSNTFANASSAASVCAIPGATYSLWQAFSSLIPGYTTYLEVGNDGVMRSVGLDNTKTQVEIEAL